MWTWTICGTEGWNVVLTWHSMVRVFCRTKKGKADHLVATTSVGIRISGQQKKHYLKPSPVTPSLSSERQPLGWRPKKAKTTNINWATGHHHPIDLTLRWLFRFDVKAECAEISFERILKMSTCKPIPWVVVIKMMSGMSSSSGLVWLFPDFFPSSIPNPLPEHGSIRQFINVGDWAKCFSFFSFPSVVSLLVVIICLSVHYCG